ncbi:amine sulfotransferase-like [Rana temporaria]|uniref:amine sulfotransferase-like n=1 Tax=Rana temporaria TaxID=8407 RepID=UPI001AADB0AA|nr:amine sulfotransferase-like [Rana temporaria]XP_040206224.1 amine sulfotransferase-like [Rana temporaria]XP_040206225.1 amine sulfotransferase-like [Rana temporaria]
MAAITSVPRGNNLYCYKGFCFLKDMMPPEYIDSLQDFKIRDDDIFLITYPKSGTIWTQQIICLICSEGHRNGTEKIDTSERMKWFECQTLNPDLDYNKLPSPRLFVSHLSETFVPQELKSKKGKIIYVMRNPKDVIKSAYHFENIFVSSEKSPDFNHFFEKFLDGEVFAGKWFDHLRGWNTHKDDYNILFLKYEDMIQDLRSSVKQICTFLGVELDDEAMDIVVKRATFKEMKKDALANRENLPERIINRKLGSFMRKGQVGDWKNILTVAQSELIEKLFQEKMGDLSLNFTWELPE